MDYSWAKAMQAGRHSRQGMRYTAKSMAQYYGFEPVQVILYGDDRPEEKDGLQHRDAVRVENLLPGHQLVLSGRNRAEWVSALTEYGPISLLIWVGHSNGDRLSLMCVSENPESWTHLDVEGLPTYNLEPDAEIWLYTCKTAHDTDAAAYDFVRHFRATTVAYTWRMCVLPSGSPMPWPWPPGASARVVLSP